MKILKPQQADYTIKTTNVIEQVQLPYPKLTARLVYVYPGVPQSTGLLTINTGTIYIGLLCDGQKVVTDALGPNDPPFKFPIPDNEDVATYMSNFLVYGNAGDGVYFRFWDDQEQKIL